MLLGTHASVLCDFISIEILEKVESVGLLLYCSITTENSELDEGEPDCRSQSVKIKWRAICHCENTAGMADRWADVGWPVTPP
jgi:hypothetical protein